MSVIRVSGTDLKTLILGVLGFLPTPRHAHLTAFNDNDGSIIDSGLALYFPAPQSYTGEDVLELQGHGGRIVVDMLLKRLINLGARLAKPGEFTERAFLNNKIDLAQAEGIADLIESQTETAARCARRSLQGEFSNRISELNKRLIELRTFVEASIDFADEDIDSLGGRIIAQRLKKIHKDIVFVEKTAKVGCLLRDGISVVIAGRPNAGKSSLLNFLSGRNVAIVTEWEGTTRDVLRENIQIDGIPLHIIDTAGLRDTDSEIEKVGIQRAFEEIKQADQVLLIIDHRYPSESEGLLNSLPNKRHVTRIFNKIDLTHAEPQHIDGKDGTEIYISIKENLGMQHIVDHLKQRAGFDQNIEALFIARRRHLAALKRAKAYLKNAITISEQQDYGCELMAEDLRLAHNSLAEVTGEFTSDDLLGEIFSSFCIGK